MIPNLVKLSSFNVINRVSNKSMANLPLWILWWRVYIFFSVKFVSSEFITIMSTSGNGTYNEPLNLTCKIHNGSSLKRFMTWKQQSKSIIVASQAIDKINKTCDLKDNRFNYSFMCSAEDDVYIMMIPGWDVNGDIHNSTWTCEDSFRGGTQSRPYTVYVNYPVSNVSLLATSEDNEYVSVIQDETVTFSCRTNSIRPPAAIQWFMGQENMTLLGKDNTVSVEHGLFISSSYINYTGRKSDDKKQIFCSGSNILKQAPVTSNIKTLEILYGPETVVISSDAKFHTVNESENINVSCLAICAPVCTYKWKGSTIQNATSSVLRLQNITRSEAGNYSCIAENFIGRKESEIFVITVNYQPKTTITFLGNDTVTENDTVHISCEVDSVPNSNVKLIFEDTTFRKRLIYPFINTQSKIYTINETRCLQMGKYSCVAQNIVGNDESYTHLLVYCTPRINFIEYDVKSQIAVPENTPINISIPIIAFPEPNILWMHNRVNLTNMTTVASYGKNRHFYNLFIKYPKIEDFGWYEIFSNDGRLRPQLFFSFELVSDNKKNKDARNLTTLGGIVGSLVMLLVILIVIWYVLRRRRSHLQKDKDHFKVKLTVRTDNDSYDNEEGLIDNILYISLDDCAPIGNSSNMNYITSKKRDNMEPEQDKKRQRSQQENIDICFGFGEESSSDGGDSDSKSPSNPDDDSLARRLVYADLVFTNTDTKPFKIRGLENRVEYAEIDLELTADPLPSDDSDHEDNMDDTTSPQYN